MTRRDSRTMARGSSAVRGCIRCRERSQVFSTMKTLRGYALMWIAAALTALPLRAEGPYRNRDNKNPRDSAEGTYPIPYQLPKAEEIAATMARIRDYLDATAPTRVIDSATGK